MQKSESLDSKMEFIKCQFDLISFKNKISVEFVQKI
jgi:hypothetical protein